MRCNENGIGPPHIRHPFRTRQVELEEPVDSVVHCALAIERYVGDFGQ